MTKLSEIGIHPDYGVYLKDNSWVPAPKYLLRRARLLKLFNGLEPGKVLEVGCGAGATSFDLAQRGFTCEALESSEQARAIANRIFAGAISKIKLHSEAKDWQEEFDYLVSFEVLEHIEHDDVALTEWAKWVKPGGYFIFSVPALKAMWGPSDVWAGHYRRYEKDELLALLHRCGLECLHFEVYGYPLSYATNFVRNRIYAQETKKMQRGDKTGTDRSGVDRTKEARFYAFQTSMLGRALMSFCCYIQVYFAKYGYGDGFIVLARKPN